MASSSMKSGACNGTAVADIPKVNVEQELYDYQMHTSMCKKIAQLTKVIYSLNTKNEEQEEADQDEEEEESASILRTRLLELQATVEEVKPISAHTYTCVHNKHIRWIESLLRMCGCVSVSGGGAWTEG